MCTPYKHSQRHVIARCTPWPGAGSAHTLTELSRAPVAKRRPSGVQEQAQMMRACAFITLPRNLKGAPPSSAHPRTPTPLTSPHHPPLCHHCLTRDSLATWQHAPHANIKAEVRLPQGKGNCA
jgi:hypothetical protein